MCLNNLDRKIRVYIVLSFLLLCSQGAVSKNFQQTESFCYDHLARLSDALLENNICSQAIVYDSLGNILNKGVANYEYGGGPNQLTSVHNDQAVKQYKYDIVGNQVDVKYENGSDYQSNQWAAFGKPWIMTRRIEANRYNSTEISYSPEHKRIQRRDYETRGGVEAVTNTQYVDNLYEQITKDQATVMHRHRISDVAVYNIHSDQSSRLSYQHKDHIDSLISETSNINQYETIKQKHLTLYSFDAWGARRDAEHWQGVVSHKGLDSVDESRGFTGHEMLDGVALIHMNGRVYDSELGRFLSPDTLIQAPSNTQSFNRYAYVWNNPLSNTDPSGECVVTAQSGVNCVSPQWSNFLQVRDSANYHLSRGNYVSAAAGIAIGSGQLLNTLAVTIGQGFIEVGNFTFRGTNEVRKGNYQQASLEYGMAVATIVGARILSPPSVAGSHFKPFRSSKAKLEYQSVKEVFDNGVSEIQIYSRQIVNADKTVTTLPVGMAPRNSLTVIYDPLHKEIFISSISSNYNRLGIGKEMVSRAIEEIGPQYVKSISGILAIENYTVYKELLRQGLSPMRAAAKTPAGKIRNDLGYGDLKFSTDDKLLDGYVSKSFFDFLNLYE